MKYDLVEIFKGGSLSRTELLERSDSRKVVRKSISIKENREYGFVRWQSQYKRLQSYSYLFPKTFPKLLNVGFQESFYFFELEYLEGFVNLKDYMIENAIADKEAHKIAERVFYLAHEMHTFANFNSVKGAFGLYLQEECFNKFEDAAKSLEFYEFAQHKKIFFNNEEFNNLDFNKEWLQFFVSKLEINKECYTHGNLTLENILFNPESSEVKFIDPYEENIIDCAEADFSQIKQCTSGHYGLLLNSNYSIDLNAISVEYIAPKCFTAFNYRLDQLILENSSSYNSIAEDFFYLSQFLRMLPFKVQSGNLEQAKIFYGLACKLLQNLRDKYE